MRQQHERAAFYFEAWDECLDLSESEPQRCFLLPLQIQLHKWLRLDSDALLPPRLHLKVDVRLYRDSKPQFVVRLSSKSLEITMDKPLLIEGNSGQSQ